MQKTEITLISDLTAVKAHESVQFGLDGSDYEIDLTKREAASLRKALSTYVEAGRKTGRTTRRRGSGSTRPTARTKTAGKAERDRIRAWANANGHPAPARGRIPAATVDAYAAANP